MRVATTTHVRVVLLMVWLVAGARSFRSMSSKAQEHAFGEAQSSDPQKHTTMQGVVDAGRGGADVALPFRHAPACPYLDWCSQDKYVKLAAKGKADTVWSAVRSDTSPGNAGWWNKISTMGILEGRGDVVGNLVDNLAWLVGREDVRTTFGVGREWKNLPADDTCGDQFEGVQKVKGMERLTRRHKVIHQQGVVARVKLLTAGATPGHPFTGIFASGFTEGIMRLSSAGTPMRGSGFRKGNLFRKDRVKRLSHLAPGMGLKAFVSGQPSKSLVAMRSLDGIVGMWNFFNNAFSTFIPSTT